MDEAARMHWMPCPSEEGQVWELRNYKQLWLLRVEYHANMACWKVTASAKDAADGYREDYVYAEPGDRNPAMKRALELADAWVGIAPGGGPLD